MRKVALIIAVSVGVASLLASAPADAQSRKGSFEIHAYGGGVLPIGALSEPLDMSFDAEALTSGDLGADMGFGKSVGGSVEYFVRDRFAVGLDLGYATLSMRDLIRSPLTISEAVTLSNVVFGAHGRWLFPSQGTITPYALAGLAYYSRGGELSSRAASLLSAIRTDSKDAAFGLQLGLGAEYLIDPRFGVGLRGSGDFTFGGYEDDIWGLGEESTALSDWRYLRLDAVATFHLRKH